MSGVMENDGCVKRQVRRDIGSILSRLRVERNCTQKAVTSDLDLAHSTICS